MTGGPTQRPAGVLESNPVRREAGSRPAPGGRLSVLLKRCLILVAISCLATSAGCRVTPYIDSEVAHRYRMSVELGPVARGWERTWVGRHLERPRVLQHRILVQTDLAGDLVKMSEGQLGKLVAERVCPPAGLDIWQQLERGQDVEVELSTQENGPFATVSCHEVLF